MGILRLFDPNMPKLLGESTIRLELLYLFLVSCASLVNMSNFVKTGRKVSSRLGKVSELMSRSLLSDVITLIMPKSSAMPFQKVSPYVSPRAQRLILLRTILLLEADQLIHLAW